MSGEQEVLRHIRRVRGLVTHKWLDAQPGRRAALRRLQYAGRVRVASETHSPARVVREVHEESEGEMKERPILFSGTMIRAILDGRKTMTRRVIKQVPHFQHAGRDIMDWDLSGVYQAAEDIKCGRYSEVKGRFYLDVQTDVDDNSHEEIVCPYGQPGDRLWVRETFGVGSYEDGGETMEGVFHYRATEPNWKCEQWKPSIHMPRRASRITLEIVSVRVERVQNITAQDALMEGACDPSDTLGQATIKWICLWNSINEKRGYGWDLNPWVWVISFRRAK